MMVKGSVIDHCQTFLLSTISSLEKFEKSKLNFICKTNSEGGAIHVDRKGRDLTRVGSQLLQGVVDNIFFFYLILWLWLLRRIVIFLTTDNRFQTDLMIGSKGSQWQPRPQTYAILSQKRICRNLRVFSNNKCPLFTRLGGGGRRKGTMSPFFTVFLIAGLP